jgi:L,D-transpeptidase catalytic domain
MFVQGRRLGLVVVLSSVLLVGPRAAFASDGPTAPGWTGPAQWTVSLQPTHLFSGPSEDSVDFGPLKALAPLQVLKYDGEWAYVYEPRGGGMAYIRSELLGPGDPPSPYLTMAPPPVEEEFDERGMLAESVPLAMYPTDAEEAVDARLSSNTWLNLDASVRGEDGSLWYRTTGGDYVPSSAVFLPDRPFDFEGRWLNVNLSTPARVTAYEGDRAVRSFLTIKGAGPRPTPTGVFTILRRVANETMNSDTIGIPRFGPGGYYLTNVLFTQYFTGDGASLHYNYWSSMWGYAGSHGCLGLTYADSAWLWGWASIGTPVDIHY